MKFPAEEKNATGRPGRSPIGWIANMRGIACLMVVMLHVSASFLVKMPPGSAALLASTLVDSFTRAAVPLFLMITGYLYINVTDVGTKNLTRIFLSILFYSIPGVLYKKFLLHEQYGILDFLTTPAYAHLWYFYILVPFMLLLFIFRPRINDAISGSRRNICLALLLVFILFLFASPLTGTLFSPADAPVKTANFALLLYLFLGALAGRLASINFIEKCMYLVLFLLCSALIHSGTASEMSATGHFVGNYFDYQNPLVISASISLFILLRFADFKSRLLDIISENSLAIYGIHLYIVGVLAKLLPLTGNYYALKIPAYFLVTTGLSLIAAMIVRRIDKNRYVT